MNRNPKTLSCQQNFHDPNLLFGNLKAVFRGVELPDSLAPKNPDGDNDNLKSLRSKNPKSNEKSKNLAKSNLEALKKRNQMELQGSVKLEGRWDNFPPTVKNALERGEGKIVPVKGEPNVAFVYNDFKARQSIMKQQEERLQKDLRKLEKTSVKKLEEQATAGEFNESITDTFFDGNEQLRDMFVEQVKRAMNEIDDGTWNAFFSDKTKKYTSSADWNNEWMNVIRPHLDESTFNHANPDDPEGQKIWVATTQFFIEGVEASGNLDPRTKEGLSEWHAINKDKKESERKESFINEVYAESPKMKEAYLGFMGNMMTEIKEKPSKKEGLREFLIGNPASSNGDVKWMEFVGLHMDEGMTNKFDFNDSGIQQRWIVALQVYLEMPEASGYFDPETQEALIQWYNEVFDETLIYDKEKKEVISKDEPYRQYNAALNKVRNIMGVEIIVEDKELLKEKIKMVIEEGKEFDQSKIVNWHKAFKAIGIKESEIEKMGIDPEVIKSYARYLRNCREYYLNFIYTHFGAEVFRKINPEGLITEKIDDIMDAAFHIGINKPDLKTWTANDWREAMWYAGMSDEEMREVGMDSKKLYISPDEIEIKLNKGLYKSYQEAISVGRLLLENNQDKLAVQAFEKAIEMNDQGIEAHYLLGIALSNLKKHKKAIEMFEKAIQLDDKYVNAYNGLGNALNNVGRPREAAKAFQKAIDIDSTYYHAYYGLGNAMSDLGNKNAAIEAYEKYIEGANKKEPELAERARKIISKLK